MFHIYKLLQEEVQKFGICRLRPHHCPANSRTFQDLALRFLWPNSFSRSWNFTNTIPVLPRRRGNPVNNFGPKLFGRWQQQCVFSLSVLQQLLLLAALRVLVSCEATRRLSWRLNAWDSATWSLVTSTSCSSWAPTMRHCSASSTTLQSSSSTHFRQAGRLRTSVTSR